MSKQRFRGLLALALALVMLFSVLYIALEAEHDCHGEDCAVCARIAVCEGLLKALALACAVLAVRRHAATCHFAAALRRSSVRGLVTPVSLKVKLSN